MSLKKFPFKNTHKSQEEKTSAWHGFVGLRGTKCQLPAGIPSQRKADACGTAPGLQWLGASRAARSVAWPGEHAIGHTPSELVSHPMPKMNQQRLIPINRLEWKQFGMLAEKRKGTSLTRRGKKLLSALALVTTLQPERSSDPLGPCSAQEGRAWFWCGWRDTRAGQGRHLGRQSTPHHCTRGRQQRGARPFPSPQHQPHQQLGQSQQPWGR